jgi:hypothetical protein
LDSWDLIGNREQGINRSTTLYFTGNLTVARKKKSKGRKLV